MAFTPETGDLWIKRSGKSLNFHLDGTTYDLSPASAWIEAGENITAGRAVSIADADWVAGDPTKTIGLAYHTDTLYVEKCIGIAIADALLGADVQVRTSGLYEWPSIAHGNPGAAPFDVEPTIADIGKIVYVAQTPDGSYTLDRVVAASGAAIIEVGILTSVYTAPGTQTAILVSLEGDGKGLNISQIQYVAGETITVATTPPYTLLQPVLVAQSSSVNPLKAGRVYLADRRKSVQVVDETYTVVGFVVPGAGVTSYSAGDTILIQIAGVIDGFTGLVPGKPVLADIDGAVTQDTSGFNYYTDTWFSIGVASSETAIALQISSAGTSDFNNLGAIIAMMTAAPDSDYLECDGSVLNAVVNPEYQPLYDAIGNTFGGTNNTDFELPDYSALTPKLQIRYKYGYSFPTDRQDAPTFRWDTQVAYSGADQVIDVDTTSFGADVILQDTTCHIYAAKGGEPTRKFEATIIGYSGYMYGFQVSKPSANTIRFTLGHNGLVYADGASFVALDATWTLTAVVYRTEKWNRFYDYTADQRLNAFYGLGLRDITMSTAPGVDPLVVDTTTRRIGEFNRGDAAGNIPLTTDHTSLNYDGDFRANDIYAATDIHMDGVGLSDVADGLAGADKVGVTGISHITPIGSTTLGADGTTQSMLEAIGNRTSDLPMDALIHHSMDDVPYLTDSTAGNTAYVQDKWINADGTDNFDGWAKTGPGTIDTTNGLLRLSGAGGGNTYVTSSKALSVGKTSIKIRARQTSGTLRTLYIAYTGGSGSPASATGTLTADWQIFTWEITGATALTQFGPTASAAGDVIEFDFVYAGSGEYASPLIDNSGNGYHATIYGSTPVDGISGLALRRDGINDYEALANFTMPDIFQYHEVWKGATSASVTQVLCSVGTFRIQRTSSSDTLRVTYSSGSSDFASYFTGYDNTDVTIDVSINWSIGAILVYRNGYLFSAATAVGTPVKPTIATLYFGTYSSANYAAGVFDERMLFARALTAAEIARLATEKTLPKYYSATFNVHTKGIAGVVPTDGVDGADSTLQSMLEGVVRCSAGRSYTTISAFTTAKSTGTYFKLEEAVLITDLGRFVVVDIQGVGITEGADWHYIGSRVGVTTYPIANDVYLSGDLVSSDTAFNIGYIDTDTSTTQLSSGVVANTKTKTINIGPGGAAGSTTDIYLGTNSGANSYTTLYGSQNSVSVSTGAVRIPSGGLGVGLAIYAGGNITTALDLAVNGGDITTTSATGNIFNASATTLNIGAAATTIDIGSTSAAAVINLNTTKDASSATVAGVLIDGGLGIAKSSYVGENLTVGNNVTIVSDLAVNGGDITTTSGTGHIFNTNATTLNIGGAATAIGIGSTGSTVTFNGTTASTSKDTGAVVIQGGLGVEKSLYVGGDGRFTGLVHTTQGAVTTSAAVASLFDSTATSIYIGRSATTLSMGSVSSSAAVYFNTTKDASSAAVAGVLIAGGVGIAKKLYVGTDVVIGGNIAINGGDVTSAAATINLFNATASTINLGGATTAIGIGRTNTGTATVNFTTASSSKDTGALVVQGGLGVEGDIYLGGTLHGTYAWNVPPTASHGVWSVFEGSAYTVPAGIYMMGAAASMGYMMVAQIVHGKALVLTPSNTATDDAWSALVFCSGAAWGEEGSVIILAPTSIMYNGATVYYAKYA